MSVMAMLDTGMVGISSTGITVITAGTETMAGRAGTAGMVSGVGMETTIAGMTGIMADGMDITGGTEVIMVGTGITAIAGITGITAIVGTTGITAIVGITGITGTGANDHPGRP
jgi:hypothetical protein